MQETDKNLSGQIQQYTLDLSKGFFMPVTYGGNIGETMDILPGYHKHENMRQEINGSWVNSYSRSIYSLAYPSGYASDIFCPTTLDSTKPIYTVSSAGTTIYYAASAASSWQTCSGTGIPSTGLSYGSWAQMGSRIVYKDQSSSKLIHADLTTPTTLYLVEPTLFTSAFNGCVCTYQNCVLVAGWSGTRIYYSLVGTVTFVDGTHPTGYYFDIGGDGKIVGMISTGGNLYIITTSAIYVRSINNAAFSSNQIDKLVSGTFTTNTVKGMCSANGNIYLATANGLAELSSNGLRYLSNKGLDISWRDISNCYLCYNPTSNDIIVYGSLTLIYSLDKNLWYAGATSTCKAVFADPNSGKTVFSVATALSPLYYIYQGNYDSSAIPYLHTMALDFDLPYYEKYIRRVYFQGENLSNIIIYDGYTSTIIFQKTFTTPMNSGIINIGVTSPSKNFSFYFTTTATSNLVIGKVVVEYEARRLK